MIQLYLLLLSNISSANPLRSTYKLNRNGGKVAYDLIKTFILLEWLNLLGWSNFFLVEERSVKQSKNKRSLVLRKSNVTFDLQWCRILHFGCLIASNACIFSGVRVGKGRNTENGGVLIERRHVGSQRRQQGFAVFQPRQPQGRITPRHPAYRAGSHALRQPVLERKSFDHGRNCCDFSCFVCFLVEKIRRREVIVPEWCSWSRLCWEKKEQ